MPRDIKDQSSSLPPPSPVEYDEVLKGRNLVYSQYMLMQVFATVVAASVVVVVVVLAASMKLAVVVAAEEELVVEVEGHIAPEAFEAAERIAVVIQAVG
jgi:hypothetical protein